MVKLSGDGYFYNAKYSKLLKGWLFNGNIFVNAKGKLIRPTLNDELRKLSKDLKKEDINFVGKFLQHDSITMSFWYESSFNKYRIDHINLPVHVR